MLVLVVNACGGPQDSGGDGSASTAAPTERLIIATTCGGAQEQIEIDHLPIVALYVRIDASASWSQVPIGLENLTGDTDVYTNAPSAKFVEDPPELWLTCDANDVLAGREIRWVIE